jgi:hypothetical protein
MTITTIASDTEGFRTLYQKGFSLIPVDGKKPFETNWTKYCLTKRTFNDQDFSDKNAGVCCGPASGILVLDIDDPVAFENLKKANHWDVPETYTVHTGGGGFHLYYIYPEDGNNYGCKSLKHPAWSGHTVLDVKGNGGFVVSPGSIHPETGRLYKVEKDFEIVEAPDWLKNFVLGGDVDRDVLWNEPIPESKSHKFLKNFRVSESTEKLILEGKPPGERSEAIGKVIPALIGAGCEENLIRFIFEHYPIGEKFREKGLWPE